MYKIIVIMIVLVALVTGCTTSRLPENNDQEKIGLPENQMKITLITGGCGYEVGNIVLLDTAKEPELGDVVQYDANVNNSYCGAFGPGIHLARIIGLAGDNVTFSECDYQTNGFMGSIKCGKGIWPLTRDVIWGGETFRDIIGMTLVVPPNEFLTDNEVGRECTGETYQDGGTIHFTRFTLRREAIIGVILEKIGHDEEFAERQRLIVY